MARCFYHLMKHTDGQTAQQIFDAVGDSMDRSVEAVVERAGSKRTGMIAAAVEIALEERGER
jgi:hypothetical protein